MLLCIFVHFNRLYILCNTNHQNSNTTLVVNVEKNKKYLKSYESVSEDIKYLTNSLVRLKIMACLYDKPQNMKDLNDLTGISYSSISSNMHDLELKGYLYRESNKYFLSNALKLKIENLMEFKEVLTLLNEFFNILDKHLVEMIPNQSIAELYLLGKATLLESDDIDVYRMYNYIENSLTFANEVKCVLPFYYESFDRKLNALIEINKPVEAIIPYSLTTTFEEKSNIKNLSTYKGKNNFLLVCTDDVMILGLFKENGYFDQNRLLTSKNPDSIKWAENLFENFKKLNK